MKRKILILDIDGTLVNSQKKIMPKTQSCIDEMLRKGHLVALASGRPYPGMRQYADALHLADYGGYALSFNGGRVISCSTGETIYEKCIPNRYAKIFYEFACERGIGMVTYQGTKAITGMDADPYMEFEVRLNHLELVQAEDFCGYVNFDMPKCLMTAEPEAAARYEKELAALVGPEINVCRSEPYFIEITVAGVDKAESVARLLQHIGMRREDCICCGDGFNDRTMVEYAGIGVAMGNAQQEVKDAADYITASCDEDGVAEVIRRFVLTDED